VRDRRRLHPAAVLGALACPLFVAFIGTVAVNSWLIARGEGRAVMHQYHQPSGRDADNHAGHSTGSTARGAQHQETR
jgi:hypothetical protein